LLGDGFVGFEEGIEVAAVLLAEVDVGLVDVAWESVELPDPAALLAEHLAGIGDDAGEEVGGLEDALAGADLLQCGVDGVEAFVGAVEGFAGLSSRMGWSWPLEQGSGLRKRYADRSAR
jgi:hypothetical protein